MNPPRQTAVSYLRETAVDFVWNETAVDFVWNGEFRS